MYASLWPSVYLDITHVINAPRPSPKQSQTGWWECLGTSLPNTMDIHVHILYTLLYSWIPYSGKLSREKTFANYDFHGENFHGLLAFTTPKDATPHISQRKLLRIATKPRNSRKFSPSKVFRYTVQCMYLSQVVVFETPLGSGINESRPFYFTMWSH